MGCVWLVGCSSDDKAPVDSSPGGSSGDSASLTGAFDACALVAKGEIQPLISETIVEAELKREGDGLRCTWRGDADTFEVLDVLSYDALDLYESSRSAANAHPIDGVGDAAHVSGYNTVYVLVGERSFFAQALVPVADGQVSETIRSAQTDADEEDLKRNEAAFRLAKIVAGKLD